MGGLSLLNFSATVKGYNFYHTEEVYSLVEAVTISGQIEYSSDIMTETNSRGISSCISLHQRLIIGSVSVFLS